MWEADLQESYVLKQPSYLSCLWGIAGKDGSLYVIAGLRSSDGQNYFGGLFIKHPDSKRLIKGMVVIKPDPTEENDFIRQVNDIIDAGAVFPKKDGSIAGPEGIERRVMVEVHSDSPKALTHAFEQLLELGFDGFAEAIRGEG